MAGSHTISAIYSGDDTYGTSTADDLPQIVAKVPATVTADNETKVYGAGDPTLPTRIRHVNGDASAVITGVTLDTEPARRPPRGRTRSRPRAARRPTTPSPTSTARSRLQASLTVTADNQSKVYGGADPTLTYTPSGTLYYGDTSAVISGVTLSTATGAAATAGTHTISATGGTAANYAITDVNGTLTVCNAR